VAKNHVCLRCGESYHCCSSCDEPAGWFYSYCSERCWSESERAKACVLLGEKLRDVLNDYERFLLHTGVWDNSSYLDKIDEGLMREKE
jgi:hypothetical protein